MLMMKELLEGLRDEPENGSVPGKPSVGGPRDPMMSALMGGHRNHSNLDIYFNILYNRGILPEVSYASGAWAHEADTKEEIYDYLRNLIMQPVPEDKEEVFRANCDKRITKTESGLYRYAYESQMFVLGWDPKQLEY